MMKYAMTADGKIATRTGASKWITGERAREEVQRMRHRYMGIMVGIGTVLADNPMLNVRLEGKKVRFVLSVTLIFGYRLIIRYAELRRNIGQLLRVGLVIQRSRRRWRLWG